MPRRIAFTLVVLLGVFVAGVAQPPVAATAQTADAAALDVIQAAYANLLDLAFQAPEPERLLVAGWDGLTRAAGGARLPAPPSLQPLPEEREAALAAFSAAYQRYVAGLPADVSRTSLAFAVADGMARGLNEQHTYFLAPSSYRNAIASTGGGQAPAGLGLRTTPRSPFIVTDVAPDGPGARAGVQVGDVVTALDERPLAGATQQAFQQALSAGTPGNVAALTLHRDGQRLEARVTSGAYLFPPLRSRLLADGAGYIRLDSFVVSGAPLADGTEVLAELDRRLDELEAQGARGLVLDLRGNLGGLVLTATELLGRFLPEDALTVVQADRRGREVTGIVSGQMRPTQLPLVVLVDGNSASASEMTAATLREAGRALLVGRPTAGSLNFAQMLPLPRDAGLFVAVSEVTTARTGTTIDRTGVPVDISVADRRTADDYRAGIDQQLEAAVAALATAPPPPAFRSERVALPGSRLRALLSRAMPDPAAMPVNDRFTRATRTTSRELTHVNQYVGSVRDPLAQQATARRRGWLGGFSQGYGAAVLARPSVGVSVHLYATPEGAAEALAENDAPEFQEPLPSPVQLGEQTVAYRGVWGALGNSAIIWRHGNAVFSAGYGDVPGFERMETLAEVARLVDQTFLQSGLPAELAATIAPAAAAPAVVQTQQQSAPGPVAETPTDATTTDDGNGLRVEWLLGGLAAVVLVLGGARIASQHGR